MNLTVAALLMTSPVTGEVIAAATTESSLPDLLSPIISTGIVGVVLVMIILRFKIMPTYVHEDALAQRDRELARIEDSHKREREGWEKERAERIAREDALRKAVEDAHNVYTVQVIPTLTRVYDELSRKNGRS